MEQGSPMSVWHFYKELWWGGPVRRVMERSKKLWKNPAAAAESYETFLCKQGPSFQVESDQCDQMDVLFSNFGHLQQRRIAQEHIFPQKLELIILQNNFEKLPKTIEIMPKRQNFATSGHTESDSDIFRTSF